MNPKDILARLREHEPDLRARGVKHAAVFGSRARGEARPDSDVDILVELEPEAEIGLWGYAEIVRALEGLFPVPVDVANARTLRPHVRPSAEREAIYAF